MSGPKGGTATVGGAGSAALGLAAIAAVALPVAAVGLVGYGAYKGTQAAAKGIDKAMKEHERHKGNMRTEIDREERPVQSLLNNGAARWQSEQQKLDSLWKKAESEWAKLRDSEGTPQTKKEAEAVFKMAEELRSEAFTHSALFNAALRKSQDKFAEARRKTGSPQRTVRGIISEGKTAGDQAVGAVNQAAESARLAAMRYEETLLIIQNKGAEERKIEMQRQNAQSNITAAKSEFTEENIAFITEWLGDESGKMLNAYVGKADAEFQAKQYEQAALSAQESVAVYRKFYTEAAKLNQQFVNREIIADALIAALTNLQYDEPDVNYEPKEGAENAMLGNLTIFAKSKGETGDMRLAVDMDGKIVLDADVPEGKEGECHQMLTDLQTKVGDVLDFNITDWGRAKNYKPDAKGGIPKQRVHVQEQVKQRGV